MSHRFGQLDFKKKKNIKSSLQGKKKRYTHMRFICLSLIERPEVLLANYSDRRSHTPPVSLTISRISFNVDSFLLIFFSFSVKFVLFSAF